jgi:hypothetical protein
MDNVALGQVFSEYFGFPCQSSFHQLLHNHHHLSSGAGTIGQQWPTYKVDSVSPQTEKLKKKKVGYFYCLETGAIERQWVNYSRSNNVDVKAIHKTGPPLGSNRYPRK